MSLEECTERLREGLQVDLPGPAAQITMAPEYRQDPSFLNIAGKPCRSAAVLVLLTPLEGAAALTFTLRPSHLPHHPGQISFPGGRREPGETLLQTAIREAQEEIGLEETVEILGQLTPLYIPPSNFCVYPYVATLDHAPSLQPQEAEVEAILHVPVAHLLDPSSRSSERRELPGPTGWVPYFAVSGYKIWGATAMMLAELLAVLSDSPLET